MRGEVIRIISARGAEPHERTMKKTAKPLKHDWSRFDAMSEAQRHAAAISDRDAIPLTPADFKRLKRTPQVKLIRRALVEPRILRRGIREVASSHRVNLTRTMMFLRARPIKE